MGFLVIHDLGDGDAVQGPVWTLSVYGGVDVQMFHYCLIPLGRSRHTGCIPLRG